MRFHDLGYFERIALIDRVGREIARVQGWRIDFNDNILESAHPRVSSCAEIASAVIEAIVAWEEEIEEKDADSID